MKKHIVLLLVIVMAVSSMLLLVGCESEDIDLDYVVFNDTFESTIELEDYEGETVLQHYADNSVLDSAFNFDTIVEVDSSYSYTVEDLEGTELENNAITLTSGDNFFVISVYLTTVESSTETDSEGNTTTTETTTVEFMSSHIINVYVLHEVTVSYYVGDTLYHSEKVMEGSKLTAPATDPTESDNVFVCWVDAEGAEIDFDSYLVYGDTEILASWEENTVTLDLNGGTFSGDTTFVVTNNTVLGSSLAEPTLDGKVFSGWCDSDGEYFDIATEEVFSDITLVAQWSDYKWTFEILTDGTIAVAYAGSNSGEVVVPNEYNGFVVTELASGAFKGYDGITSVTLADTITSVGSFAFNDCSSLVSVVLPSGLDSIEDFAFMGCTSLPSITIPDTVTKIGLWAFVDCTSIEVMSIPSSVTTLENYVFKNCTSLILYCEASSEPSNWGAAWDSYGPVATYWGANSESLVVIDDVTYLLDSKGTATITQFESTVTDFVVAWTITVGDTEYTVNTIGAGSFAGCTTLETITFYSTVNYIEADAFAGCTNLTIKCEQTSKGYSWDTDWNSSACTVEWGAVTSPTVDEDE